MPRYETFFVSVTNSDGPLIEYVDPDQLGSDSACIVRYVEAVANTVFGVQYSLEPAFNFQDADYVGVDVYLDGYQAARMVISRQHYHDNNDDYTLTVRTMANGVGEDAWLEQQFMFGDLRLSDRALQKAEMKGAKLKHKDLGTIQVEYWRCRGRPTEQNIAEAKYQVRNDSETVPEQVLKGKAMELAVRVDEGTKTERGEVWTTEYLDDRPLASFVFKYRSKRALMALGVLARGKKRKAIDEAGADRVRVKQEPVLVPTLGSYNSDGDIHMGDRLDECFDSGSMADVVLVPASEPYQFEGDSDLEIIGEGPARNFLYGEVIDLTQND